MKNQKSNRIWWLVVVFFLLLNTLVWQRSSVASWLGRISIRLASNDSPNTTGIIRWAEWIDQDSPEVAFAKARQARRLNDFETFNRQLTIAKYRGMDEARIERERWFAAAQSGQISLVKDKLALLTDSPGGDEAEICEAFAVGYIRLRDFESAIYLLEAWRLDFPKDARPYAWMGQIYTELKDTENAESSFRKALALNSRNALAALGLGELLLDVKRPDEAKSFFELAMLDEKLEVSATVGFANSLMALGELELASKTLREALNKYPKDHQLLTAMGTVLVERGDYAGAEELLRPTVESGSLRRELRYAYALALRGVGRTEDATIHFDYATRSAQEIAKANQLIPDVTSRPDDVELRFRIGETHLNYGNIEDGLMWLQSVLELDPNYSRAHAALAEHYQRSFGTDPRAMIKARQHLLAVRLSRNSP